MIDCTPLNINQICAECGGGGEAALGLDWDNVLNYGTALDDVTIQSALDTSTTGKIYIPSFDWILEDSILVPTGTRVLVGKGATITNSATFADSRAFTIGAKDRAAFFHMESNTSLETFKFGAIMNLSQEVYFKPLVIYVMGVAVIEKDNVLVEGFRFSDGHNGVMYRNENFDIDTTTDSDNTAKDLYMLNPPTTATFRNAVIDVLGQTNFTGENLFADGYEEVVDFNRWLFRSNFKNISGIDIIQGIIEVANSENVNISGVNCSFINTAGLSVVIEDYPAFIVSNKNIFVSGVNIEYANGLIPPSGSAKIRLAHNCIIDFNMFCDGSSANGNTIAIGKAGDVQADLERLKTRINFRNSGGAVSKETMNIYNGDVLDIDMNWEGLPTTAKGVVNVKNNGEVGLLKLQVMAEGTALVAGSVVIEQEDAAIIGSYHVISKNFTYDIQNIALNFTDSKNPIITNYANGVFPVIPPLKSEIMSCNITAAQVINLPLALNLAGVKYYIAINEATTVFALTVNPNGADTIGLVNAAIIVAAGTGAILMSDGGTNWLMLSAG